MGIGVTGDGDTASIGIGQFMHLVRRNMPLIYIIEDNGVYGLTRVSSRHRKPAHAQDRHRQRSAALRLLRPGPQMGRHLRRLAFSGDKQQCRPS
jgi:2-oxoglutarate ferredoxin oxidoreductase subunit beta